jgi:hypothetical protein
MPGFDPSSAVAFDPSTAQSAFDPTSAKPIQAPQAPRPAGATGVFDQLGQTFQDLTDSNHPQHDPNALESGIMGVAYSKPVQSLQANYQQAVNTGLFMEPVRASMEALGVGRQPGESNASLHQRYNDAVTQSRQQAQQQAQDNTVGAYDGDPLHMAERFAQQTGNVAAGIVANPQYALLPSMGVGNTVAARIGTSALGNAGVGGVSDAAAQLMDIAEGQKKDFDVEQNIKSTLAGAAFGGVLHGSIEVAPYVKGLFANRGMDTTPAENPTGNTIQPMTSDHVAMNQADHMQYQHLLQTGSVDDIKQFFQGRQGPQPSWSDVNTWVEHRDNPPATTNGQAGPDPTRQPDFNYQDEYNAHAEAQYREQNRQAVEDHVNNKMSGWSNAPQVEVVHSPQDIADPAIRDSAIRDDPNGDALGFLGSDGKVRMFSGRITDPDTANAVLFHEGLGHFGLAQKFGDKLDSVLQSMLDRNVNSLSKDTDAWQKQNPGAYGGDRLRAAEEVLAERSQSGKMPNSWQDAVTSSVKQFGRKMGLDLAYSDAEVNHVLSMAHDAVINGKPSAAANGFRGATQDPNKFMFTGPQATGYDEAHPTAYRAKDGIIRNEISDRAARLYESPGDTLGSTLHHPALFEQYPELHSLPVEHENNPNSKFAGGYDPHDPETMTGGKLYINHSSFMHAIDPLGVTLHEIQHAIQDIEKYPDFVRAMKSGGTSRDPLYTYETHPSEEEARSTEQRMHMREGNRERIAPSNKFMRTDALGRIPEDEDNLNQVDRLKADPRYWQDPEYRANVNEIARAHMSGSDIAGRRTLASDSNKFMRGMPHTDINNLLQNAQPDELEAIRSHGLAEHEYMIASHEREINDIDMGHTDFDPKAEKPLRDELVERRQSYIEDAKELSSAKSPGAILQHLPAMTKNSLQGIIDRNTSIRSEFGLPPEEMPNKFITRAQLARSRGTKPGYEMDDIESVAQHIDANYTPNVMTREEIRQQAIENGINPADLKGRDVGELSARLSKIGYAANYAGIKVKGILDRLDTPDWKPEDHVKLAESIAQRNALVEMFKGESNELGRALNTVKVFKSFTNGNLADVMEQLRDSGSGLAGLADPTNPEGLKFARQLKQALQSNSNPKGAAAMMAGVNKPYWEQYLTTIHMNMMLSALSTHVKAPVDMATGITRNVIEKAVAMPIGQVRQVFEMMSGKTPEPGVGVAELANHMIGIMRAVSDAEVYRQSWNALKTGNSSYVQGGKVTPTNFANTFGATSNPRIPGVSKFTDAISAQDTFYRSVEMNAQMDALGAREARVQLGPKASISDVMTLGHTIAMNPTQSMLKEAFDLTNRTLLLNNNPLNNIVNKARVYTPGMNPAQRVGKFLATNLMPFIRVESNSLMSRIIQRSPLGLLDPYTISQLKAGGAKADIAMSKMLYGTVLLGMMWVAADKGKDYLTGDGPGNVDQYKQKIASGWRPDAVHEDGRYMTGGNQLGMSINPFDMHNKTAQMVASMREAYDAGANGGQVGNGLKLAFGSLMSNLARQSWASDVDPALSAITAQGQEGQSTVQSFANRETESWMPNLFGQIARVTDPNQRDTSAPGSMGGAMLHTAQSMIPGAREQLPIKYSVYGTPLAQGASWSGVHTPIGLSGNGTTQTTDPTEMELDRLNTSLPDIRKTLSPAEAADLPQTLITPVAHTIKLSDGTPKTLNPKEFEDYQHLAGVNIVATVGQEMSTPRWQTMSDHDKVLEVRSIETDMKNSAKEALFDQ